MADDGICSSIRVGVADDGICKGEGSMMKRYIWNMQGKRNCREK